MNNIELAITQFDQYLITKGLTFECSIIGGAALSVLKVTNRFTRDVDCLIENIPEEIKTSAINFAKENPQLNLAKDWLNNGPSQLLKNLPDGWQSRLQLAFNGTNLKLTTLGRSDLLKTKLFAYCDRNDPDYADLLKLKPTREELSESIAWVKLQDANPGWPDNVEKLFLNLKQALHG